MLAGCAVFLVLAFCLCSGHAQLVHIRTEKTSGSSNREHHLSEKGGLIYRSRALGALLLAFHGSAAARQVHRRAPKAAARSPNARYYAAPVGSALDKDDQKQPLGTAPSDSLLDGENNKRLPRWILKFVNMFAFVRSLCARVAHILRAFAQRVAAAISGSKRNPGAESAGSTMPLWSIVGDALIVRSAQSLQSDAAPEWLMRGAVVQEAEISGQRLHYKLVSGMGPREGWISTKVKDRILAERLPLTSDPAPAISQPNGVVDRDATMIKNSSIESAESPASRTQVRLPEPSDEVSLPESSDDDGSEPKTDVRWLDLAQTRNTTPSEGALTMPVFPYRKTFLLWQRPVFNIFEPRHIKMYNDIIFSGARRFLICRDDPDGNVAEVGAMVYLEDLKAGKPVANLIGGVQEVKYIGNHSVIGRARIVKVVDEEGEYPLVEVEELQDSDIDEDTGDAEADVRKSFEELIDMQAKLGEKPCFFPEFKTMLDFSRGTDFNSTGMWGTLDYWQQFLGQKLEASGYQLEQLQEEAGKRVLKRNGLNYTEDLEVTDIPDAVKSELGDELRAVAATFTKDFNQDYNPFGLQMQTIMQSTSHRERLSLFQNLIDTELKRLVACATLAQAIGDGASSSPE